MKIDDKYDGFKSFDELVSESKNLNQTNRTNFAFSQNNFDDRKETLQNHKHKKTLRHLFDIGSIISIQAFKYDGTLYRQYEGAKIIANLKDFVVLLLLKSKVAEQQINWIARDPILFFFAKNKFYNATVTLKENKHNYIYVNLSSPFYINNNVIQYIDFDIDVKSYIDEEFNVIDWQDFKESITKYHYSFQLIHRLYDELDYLFDQFKTKNGVFSTKLVDNIEKMLKEQGDI